MDKATVFGVISGVLVFGSVIPYSLRIYQGKIFPNLTSWSLWTLISLAILLTYKSSGAEGNVWPAIFGFIGPIIITSLAVWRRGEWTKPDRLEIACIIIGLTSLALWSYAYGDKELSAYALVLAIIGDLCAAIPTIKFLWKNPDRDRPFAWGCFALGYGLSILAITENTFSNYILPIYMACGASTVTSILAYYRLKNKIPLREWI